MQNKKQQQQQQKQGVLVWMFLKIIQEILAWIKESPRSFSTDVFEKDHPK